MNCLVLVSSEGQPVIFLLCCFSILLCQVFDLVTGGSAYDMEEWLGGRSFGCFEVEELPTLSFFASDIHTCGW